MKKSIIDFINSRNVTLLDRHKEMMPYVLCPNVTNLETSKELFIARATVDQRSKAIYNIFDVDNKAELQGQYVDFLEDFYGKAKTQEVIQTAKRSKEGISRRHI